MQNKKQMIVYFLGFLLLILFPVSVNAEEDGGGQVNTEGEISFFDEDSTQQTSENSDSKEKNKQNDTTTSKNRLPQTGEIKHQETILGICFAVGSIFLYYSKRRREGESS